MDKIEIGFVGTESVDIILYVARLYTAAGSRVAVIDCTNKKALLRATSLPNTLLQSTGFYRNILMLNGAVDYSKDKENQDVLLYNFGYDVSNELVAKCPNLVYVTDMMVYNSEILRDVEDKEDARRFLVVRNYVTLKYDEKYLAGLIEKPFNTEEIMVIPYDESDYKTKCYLCVDKKHKLSSLSKNMIDVVMEIYLATSRKEVTRKEKAALLKRA